MSTIDLDYDAITIDTSIFDNNGIALERGLLNQLDQFKDSPVQILISEIIDNEVTAHLTDKIKDARSKIEKALRAAKEQLRISEQNIVDAKILISDSGEDIDVARGRLTDFYQKTDTLIIPCDGAIDITKLINMYFSLEAPFERNADKKNEFPDALALLSLESWAENNNLNILAVSSDKGWSKYAENSKRIDVIDNLADALAHFQPHNFAKNVIEAIKSDYKSGSTNYLFEAIIGKITDSLDGIDIRVEASSSFYFEEDDVYATYINHELYCDSTGYPEVNIIRVDAELLMLQVTANVTCEVHASFELSIWDSTDKEYMGMGSTPIKTEEEYTTEILISLSGDFTKGLNAVQVEDIEVTDTLFHVDFGEIEPNWWDDEY